MTATPLGRLGQGRHTISAAAYDEARNRARQARDLTVVAFGPDALPIPGSPPRAELVAVGDPASVSPGSILRVRFSEPVKGAGPTEDGITLKRDRGDPGGAGKTLHPKTRDLMTYAPQAWLSDYHYAGWWTGDLKASGVPLDLSPPTVRMATPGYAEGDDSLTADTHIELAGEITIEYEVRDEEDPSPELEITLGGKPVQPYRKSLDNKHRVTLTRELFLGLGLGRGMAQGMQLVATPRDDAGNVGTPARSKIIWIPD